MRKGFQKAIFSVGKIIYRVVESTPTHPCASMLKTHNRFFILCSVFSAISALNINKIFKFPGVSYTLSIPFAAHGRRSFYHHDGLWHDRASFLSNLKQRATKKLEDFKITRSPKYEKRTEPYLFDDYEDVWKRSFPGFGSK